MAKYTINQISKTVDKVFGAEFNTNQKILNINASDMIKIPIVSKTEIEIVANLQRVIRNKSVTLFLAFLRGEEIPEPPKRKEGKNGE